MNTMTDLTDGSRALLEDLWADRANWAGMPLFGGNVGGSPASLGHLTDLKKKGYVITEQDYDDPSLSWVIFTDKTEALFASPACSNCGAPMDDHDGADFDEEGNCRFATGYIKSR